MTDKAIERIARENWEHLRKFRGGVASTWEHLTEGQGADLVEVARWMREQKLIK